MEKPLISVVIGSLNRLRFLKLTIDSVRMELEGYNYEIIVVDGGSIDKTYKWLFSQKDIVTIIQHNIGSWRGKKIKKRSWGYYMNLGFKCAQGKYICMISDDCLVVPNAIKNGIKHFDGMLKSGKNIGALAFYYRDYPDDTKYYVNYCFDKVINLNHGLYLNSALKDINYVDEESFMFYCGDVDTVLRLIEKGYLVDVSPNSFIEHTPHVGVIVRIQNNQQQINGYLALKRKWGHRYIFKGAEEFSVHKEVSFNDESNTAYRFSTKYQLLHFNFLYILSIIKNKLKIRKRIEHIIGKKTS